MQLDKNNEQAKTKDPSALKKNEVFVSTGDSRPDSVKKAKYQIILVVLVLIVIIGGLWIYSANTHSPNELSSQREQLITRAAHAIHNNNNKSLAGVVTDIKKYPDYENYPNLLYPIVIYYIRTGNSLKAKQEYKILKTAYKNKPRFSNKYETVNMKVLEMQIKVSQSRVIGVQGIN